MSRLRRILLWAVMVITGLLAMLSVIGAFLGAGRARELFNSPPLIALWILLGGLLVAGLLCFKRLSRSPGLLAMHVGPLLILAGAMYGSDAGHRMARELFGREKEPWGYMAISEGAPSDQILDDDLMNPVGKLPFSLLLRDFWIEYYDAEDKTWLLVAMTPHPSEKYSPGDAGQELTEPQKDEPLQSVIDWRVGQETDIPRTNARLRVMEYLASARPVYAEDAEPVLEIMWPDGKKVTVPAVVGQEVSLDEPNGKLRIVGVYSNLVVRGPKKKREVVDAAGSAGDPGLKVQIVRPNGTKQSGYVLPHLPTYSGEGIELRYRLPDPIRAAADSSSELPAMKLMLSYKGKEQEAWLIADGGTQPVWLSLAPLLGLKEADGADTPSLYFVEPLGPISDCKSDLAVLRDGITVAHKVIEVNDPLHYGGYHFYQSGHDPEDETLTILLVKSDSGLWLAYAGFLLLCGGVFWQCWGKPVLVYVRRRRNSDT